MEIHDVNVGDSVRFTDEYYEKIVGCASRMLNPPTFLVISTNSTNCHGDRLCSLDEYTNKVHPVHLELASEWDSETN